MATHELTFAFVPEKKILRKKIIWTQEMTDLIIAEFPVSYNRELAKKIGVSMSSLIRKARELGIEKEPMFLDKRREEITEMAIKALPPQPTKGRKGWCVPKSEQTRFMPGHIPAMKVNREVVDKVTKKRNETIARDRRRLRLGLKQLTKLKLSV